MGSRAAANEQWPSLKRLRRSWGAPGRGGAAAAPRRPAGTCSGHRVRRVGGEKLTFRPPVMETQSKTTTVAATSSSQLLSAPLFSSFLLSAPLCSSAPLRQRAPVCVVRALALGGVKGDAATL